MILPYRWRRTWIWKRRYQYCRHVHRISSGIGTRNDHFRILSIPIFFISPFSTSSPEARILNMMPYFLFLISSMYRDASMPTAIDRQKKAIYVVLYLFCCPPCVSSAAISVFLDLCHCFPLSSRISTATIVSRPSPPPTLSDIPIILNFYCASIVILLHLCCGIHRIIFYHPAYLSTIVCLPSSLQSSPCSTLFCTAMLAHFWSALLFSHSALIFSLRFSILSWHSSSLSMWYCCSALICHVFLHLPSLLSTPI